MTNISKKILPIFALIATSSLFTLPAQAVDIKQQQINHCTNGMVSNKVADQANAQKMCSCQVNIRSKMTIGQTWEIESYAQSGKDPSQLPYVQQMQKEFEQCTQGVKLNLPTNNAG